jgi:hypothetical protein
MGSKGTIGNSGTSQPELEVITPLAEFVYSLKEGQIRQLMAKNVKVATRVASNLISE